jgi:hypothetical protein
MPCAKSSAPACADCVAAALRPTAESTDSSARAFASPTATVGRKALTLHQDSSPPQAMPMPLSVAAR